MATLTAGQSITVGLDAWATLSLVVSGKATLAFTSGAENVHPSFEVTNATSRDFGPYGCPMSVVITAVDRSLTYTITGGVGGYQYDSSGNVTGLVGLGADIGSNVLLIGTGTRSSGDEKVAIAETNTNPDADVRPVLTRVDQAVDPAASGTIDWHALDVRCYGGGTNANFSANSGFYGAEGKTQFNGSAGQTMGKTVGVFGSSVMNGSSATLNLSIGVQGEIQNTGAGTTVNAAAFYAKTPIISAGAVTSAYGLFVQSVTGATANFAICTQAGRTWFHSTVAPPAGGSFKVGLLMSSTDTLGVYFGSGAPTVSASQGSLYLRTDGSSTSTRMYVNTDGSTGWTAVTTAT